VSCVCSKSDCVRSTVCLTDSRSPAPSALRTSSIEPSPSQGRTFRPSEGWRSDKHALRSMPLQDAHQSAAVTSHEDRDCGERAQGSAEQHGAQHISTRMPRAESGGAAADPQKESCAAAAQQSGGSGAMTRVAAFLAADLRPRRRRLTPLSPATLRVCHDQGQASSALLLQAAKGHALRGAALLRARALSARCMIAVHSRCGATSRSHGRGPFHAPLLSSAAP
jgi:hypothetical protein